MTKLSVNVNRVALLRNSRPLDYPSPARLSRIALQAGAHGITVHPRPDYRHIRRSDVDDIANLLREPRWISAGAEFNIEGNPFEGDYLDIVRAARPTQCTLVPDTPGQATSDHGWKVSQHEATLKKLVRELKSLGCRVSLFIDPDVDEIRRAADTAADRVELYTEPYAAAHHCGGADAQRALDQYARAADAALAAGFGLNAGHDLSLANLADLLRRIPRIAEVSIGHALTADALELGMPAAVHAYLDVIRSATERA